MPDQARVEGSVDLVSTPQPPQRNVTPGAASKHTFETEIASWMRSLPAGRFQVQVTFQEPLRLLLVCQVFEDGQPVGEVEWLAYAYDASPARQEWQVMCLGAIDVADYRDRLRRASRPLVYRRVDSGLVPDGVRQQVEAVELIRCAGVDLWVIVPDEGRTWRCFIASSPHLTAEDVLKLASGPLPTVIRRWFVQDESNLAGADHAAPADGDEQAGAA